MASSVRGFSVLLFCRETKTHSSRQSLELGPQRRSWGNSSSAQRSDLDFFLLNRGPTFTPNSLYRQSYSTIGLLGCETDSYDSEGAVARLAPWRHVSQELLVEKLGQFRGPILQTPPMCVHAIDIFPAQQFHRYSALKVEGKPLYEYAREGIPLPRPIQARPVRVDHIALTSFTPSASPGDGVPESGHHYGFPAKRLSAEQREERLKMLRLVDQDQGSGRVQEAQLLIKPASLPALPTSPDHFTQLPQPPKGGPEKDDTNVEEDARQIGEIPPVFELEMTVSSGTYVRTVVHDLAIAVGSAAHVVSLTRTRQGPFVLTSCNANACDDVTRSAGETQLLDCVDWAVLEDALRKLEAGEEIGVDEDGWTYWELEILRKWPDQSGLKVAARK
jgi:tRNA pseudouridine55 synthase